MEPPTSYLDRLRDHARAGGLRRLLAFLRRKGWGWGLAALAAALGIGLGLDYWLFEISTWLFSLALGLAVEIAVVCCALYRGKDYRMNESRREELAAGFLREHETEFEEAFGAELARERGRGRKLPRALRTRLKVESLLLLILRQYARHAERERLADSRALFEEAVADIQRSFPEHQRAFIKQLGQFLWPRLSAPFSGESLWPG